MKLVVDLFDVPLVRDGHNYLIMSEFSYCLMDSTVVVDIFS